MTVIRLEDARGYWRHVNVNDVLWVGPAARLKAQTWSTLLFHPVESSGYPRVYRALTSAIGPDQCTCPLHQPAGWNRPAKANAQ